MNDKTFTFKKEICFVALFNISENELFTSTFILVRSSIQLMQLWNIDSCIQQRITYIKHHVGQAKTSVKYVNFFHGETSSHVMTDFCMIL